MERISLDRQTARSRGYFFRLFVLAVFGCIYVRDLCVCVGVCMEWRALLLLPGGGRAVEEKFIDAEGGGEFNKSFIPTDH